MANFEEHVQTDFQSNLKQRSLQSGLITFAAQPFKLAVGIGATAVLARLVTPADFGLLAMVSPLAAFADSLSNFGLETATVQQPGLTYEQANAVFWFSLKVNIGVAGLMAAMGPMLAKFYGQPSLTLIAPVMAIGFFSLCLSFQHQALMKRQMRFELLTAIELGAIAISTTAAIAAAWLGWGYWALVLQIVIMQIVQGSAYWLTCGWQPNWKKESTNNIQPSSQKNDSQKTNLQNNGLQSMLSYGAHLTGFRFITRVGMQLDRILVGYISGATTLGFYDVAYRWATFPFNQVYFSLFDVAVSSFSRAYSDPATYRRYCQWGMMAVFSLWLPATAFLFVDAKDVLLLLLGSQWLAAVPIFQLLTIAMFFGSAQRVTKWLYLSSGQMRRQLTWGILNTPLMIAALCLGAQWGAYGIAVAYTVTTCSLMYPSIAFCLKRSPLTTTDFFGAIWRPAIASILSAAGLFLIRSSPFLLGITHNSLLKLSIEAIYFGLAYCLLWIFLPGGRRSALQITVNLQLIFSRKGDEPPEN